LGVNADGGYFSYGLISNHYRNVKGIITPQNRLAVCPRLARDCHQTL